MQTVRLNLKQWALYLLVLLVVGCSARPVMVEESVELEQAEKSAELEEYVPARDALFSNEETPLGFGAYGYLIFTKRPDKYDFEDDKYNRYEAVFRAFIGNLEPVDDYKKKDWPLIMPTFWLLQGEQGKQMREGNNSFLLDKSAPDPLSWIKFYDYARAKRIASSINVLSSKGTILVAWTKPFENVGDNEEALVLDLSDFLIHDLNRAFGVWMHQISHDPEIWHDGFNLVKAKWAFHNFLENYGDKIIDAVRTIKGIIG